LEFLTTMSNKSNNFWYKASFLTPFFDFGGFALNVFSKYAAGFLTPKKVNADALG
jgi:hypothetical protein